MEQTKSLPCNVCGTEYVRTTDYWHKQPKHADGLSETCKLCAIARARAHYAANKQRHAENVTAYRKAHPEMLQRERELLKQQRRAANPERFIERTGEEREAAEMERRKRYYKANRAKLIAANRERRKVDPDKARAIRQRYYKAHKAEIIAKSLAWRENNREKARRPLEAVRQGQQRSRGQGDRMEAEKARLHPAPLKD